MLLLPMLMLPMLLLLMLLLLLLLQGLLVLALQVGVTAVSHVHCQLTLALGARLCVSLSCVFRPQGKRRHLPEALRCKGAWWGAHVCVCVYAALGNGDSTRRTMAHKSCIKLKMEYESCAVCGCECVCGCVDADVCAGVCVCTRVCVAMRV